MEDSSGFDLEGQIHAWRRSLAEASGLDRSRLDELEDHLRASHAQLRDSHLTPEEAFHLAARRLGSKETLAREFSKESPERLLMAFMARAFAHNLGKLGLCAAGGLVAAALIFVLAHPRYESTATLLLRPGTIRTQEGYDASMPVSTLLAILGGHDVAAAATASMGQGKAVAQFRSGLSIRPRTGSDVVDLKYSDRSRQVPEAALGFLLQAFKRQVVAVHGDDAIIRDFLAEEADRDRSRLERTAKALEAERKGQRFGATIDEESNAVGQTIAQSTAALSGLAADIAQQKAMLTASNQQTPVNRGAVADLSMTLAGLQARFAVFEGQRARAAESARELESRRERVEELEQQKQMEEKNVRYFSDHLQETRMNEALLGSTATGMITMIEPPAPAAVFWSATIRQMISAATLAVVLGLVWALLTELWLARLRRLDGNRPPSGPTPASRPQRA